MTTNERSVPTGGVRGGRSGTRAAAPLIGFGTPEPSWPSADSTPVLWRALRHRWYLVVLAALLGASLGYVVSDRQETTYEATSTVVLSDRAFGEAAGAIRPDVAATLVEFHTERVVASDMLELAGEELGLDPGFLGEVVTSRPEVPGLAVTVIATVGTPDQAADIADAVALAYEQSANQRGRASQESEQEQLQDRIDVLGERIDEEQRALDARPTDREAMQRVNGLVTQQLDLQQRLDDLSDTRQVQIVSSVFAAAVPTAPASPLPLRDAALAGLAAVLAATAVIWFSATRRSDACSTIAGVTATPLLAEIPASGSRRHRTADPDATTEVSDAMHLVSDAIQRFHGGQGAVVLFTGVGPDRDRHQAARATAVVAADSDADVTLLWHAADRPSGRWFLPRRRRRGAWFAERVRSGLDSSPVELAEALRHGRATDSLVLVAGPDASTSEATNLALASDAIVLVASARDNLPDLVRLRQRLNVANVPVIGYIYRRQHR